MNRPVDLTLGITTLLAAIDGSTPGQVDLTEVKNLLDRHDTHDLCLSLICIAGLLGKELCGGYPQLRDFLAENLHAYLMFEGENR